MVQRYYNIFNWQNKIVLIIVKWNDISRMPFHCSINMIVL